MVKCKQLPAPYSRYAVSRCGKYVLSRTRKNNYKWTPLKQATQKKSGYKVVCLFKDGGDPKGKLFTVHTLVLTAWVGPCPPGLEACHYPDWDRTNNSLDNLKWGTRSENSKHRYEQGCKGMGEKHHGAKLTEAQVRQARREWDPWRRNGGKTVQDLADEFGVTHEVMRKAVKGIGWKHVE